MSLHQSHSSNDHNGSLFSSSLTSDYPFGLYTPGPGEYIPWSPLDSSSGNIMMANSDLLPMLDMHMTSSGFSFGGSARTDSTSLDTGTGVDCLVDQAQVPPSFQERRPPKFEIEAPEQNRTSRRGQARDHTHHAYVRVADQTSISNEYAHICQIDSPCHDTRYFACAYRGCGYPVGFNTLQEAVAHVRSTHVPDKPFTCTTCGASFMRKQDAVRHVNTMNSGKKYKCCVCKEAYSRKDYCLVHEKRCMATRRNDPSS